MITKQILSSFRTDMDAAMAAVYEKHGLTQSAVKISYGDHTFKVNFEVGEKDATGGVDPTYFKGLERHGWKHGLDTSDLNKEVTIGRKTYTFLGMNQTGHFCIGEDKAAPGKLYKLKGDEVAKALGKAPRAGTLIQVAAPNFR